MVAHILAVFSHFPQGNKITTVRVREEEIDQNRPWGYFDGASQEHHLICRGGGFPFLSPTHFYYISVGLGRGSNNFVEPMELKPVLLFFMENGCHTLQVFGDSLIVIDWERGNSRCHVIQLLPILEEVVLLQQWFNCIAFTHVYRAQNQVADMLSKESS